MLLELGFEPEALEAFSMPGFSSHQAAMAEQAQVLDGQGFAIRPWPLLGSGIDAEGNLVAAPDEEEEEEQEEAEEQDPAGCETLPISFYMFMVLIVIWFYSR